MKSLVAWFDTTCEFCLAVRNIIINAAKLAASLIMILLLLFSGLLFYWLFIDTAPAVQYGPNGRAEFSGDRIIFHLDATRIRDCPTTIHRKIGGCGQIDFPDTIATTPVGDHAGPVSYPLDIIFTSFSREQLSGNVCTIVSQATSYCNPAQRLLKMPIVTQSPPIQFIPVPRVKSYDNPMP